jgi:ABC-type polar amino acid transport system ATPase subunit
MLKIKNLSKKIRHKPIIQDLSLEVERGQIAVLLGSSGVGKSTLLRILNNLETVDQGTVELDGEVLNLDQVNQSHTVGMVFQHFNLFEHLTVLQNITLALEKVVGQTNAQAQIIAQDLLHRYGLADRASAMPAQLSGGQKQRLAIARTLALKPKVVCMDEPTSALDPLLTTYVAHNIKELAQQGYVVLVATHDISLLEKLPCTIYLMQNGTIIESVTSSDFFAHKTNYPALADFVAGQ